MRILFISRWYPYPPDNGSRIRVFNLIKHLSKRHEITLLSFAQGRVSEARLEAMGVYCQSVQVVPYRAYNPCRLRAMLGLFLPYPRSVLDTHSEEMQGLVREMHAAGAFDMVLASEIDCMPYVLSLNGTPRVLEDLELSVIRERCSSGSGTISRARHQLTWLKLSGYVARSLRQLEGCTVVSDRERDLVLGITPGYRTLAIVPNGVDLEAHGGSYGAPEPDTLIYPGALTYGANLDAMEYFVREIFPELKSRHPDLRLRITGRYDGVPVEHLVGLDGVVLTGYLEDIRPAVARSRACVVPLREGGGTRLKILEAMALGTPVVATAKGAEGLAVTHGQDILLADGPAQFARAVARVLEDGELWERLSTNGRRLVSQRYSWEVCARQLEQVLLAAQGQRGAGDD